MFRDRPRRSACRRAEHPRLRRRARPYLLASRLWAILVVAAWVGASSAAWADPQPRTETLRLSHLRKRLEGERKRLARAFGVDAELALFDDGDVPNAMAFGRQTSLGFWGIIYLGQTLLMSDLAHPAKGPDALLGILAHEFAHVLQAQRACPLEGVDRELHADFLAGWYWARRAGPAGRVSAVARALADRADAEPLVAGAAFGRDHGSALERITALLAGVAARALRLEAAYEAGTQRLLGLRAENADLAREDAPLKRRAHALVEEVTSPGPARRRGLRKRREAAFRGP